MAPLSLLLSMAASSLLLLALSPPIFLPLAELLLRFLAASTTDLFTREGGREGSDEASLACEGVPFSALADVVTINAAVFLRRYRPGNSFDAFEENWATDVK